MLQNFTDLSIIEELLISVEFLTFSNLISSLVNIALIHVTHYEHDRILEINPFN